MRKNAMLASLVAAAGFIASAAVFGQETAAQPQPAPAAASMPTTPSAGTTMEDVRAKFGSPAQEVPAVGQPPITRWEYPGYVVFFEHDRVLHTVVVRS